MDEAGSSDVWMGLAILVLALIGAVVVARMLWRLLRPRKRRPQAQAAATTAAVQEAPALALAEPPAQPQLPQRIVVAAGDRPVFAMSMLDVKKAKQQLASAKPVSGSMLGRALEPFMQMAPSLATAGMAQSSGLMEVVVNGQLVAAADGNGLRAIAMGADGIKEHARLFEPSGLQNVANAAAIWQLASVVVAQKHLADISATLKRVEAKVEGVKAILEEERAALIQSALNYINTTRQAMEKGEFLERTRDKLEDFEIRLEQAGLALVQQIRRESGAALDVDTVGCEGEYRSARAKHMALAERARELVACAEVRLANWYLCTLYPDQSRMLEGRMNQIQAFLAEVSSVHALIGESLDSDCLKIDASFTFESTITERRQDVRGQAKPGLESLIEGGERCGDILIQVEAASAARARPMRLLVEVQNGHPQSIYLSDKVPRMPALASA